MRCVVVITDGLRPDAIGPDTTPNLHNLAANWAASLDAVTVSPSVTVAALTSLATGVAPATHRLTEPGLRFLTRLGGLEPVARVLAQHRVPTIAVAGPLSLTWRPVAHTLSAFAGVQRLVCARAGARAIAALAAPIVGRAAKGLFAVYLPDCDQAGHAYGWMSTSYMNAARQVDAAVGLLATFSRDALLVVVSDHGGGGTTPAEHDSDHPANLGIPLLIAGPGVQRVQLGRASLLDVPPTILRWFGAAVPASYEGRILAEAFAAGVGAAA